MNVEELAARIKAIEDGHECQARKNKAIWKAILWSSSIFSVVMWWIILT